MNALKPRLVRCAPNWSKPALRLLSALARETKFTLERVKRRIHPPSLPKNNKVYIHLGGGEINIPEFINVDIRPLSHIHYVRSAEDLDIFPDKYADLVYACHLLEHFGVQEVPKVLKEWQRILKAGGILRLSVPDFDKLIEIYEGEKRDIQAIISPLTGSQNVGYSPHMSVFKKEYLTQLLLSTGFREVREWNPDEVKLHQFDDWASRPIVRKSGSYSVSLNLEAVR